MRGLNKDTSKKLLNALVATLAIAAVFHLVLVTLTAIVKYNISYLNPLDFLGISILFPGYRDSRTAAGLGWLVLIGLFFLVLFIRVRYHLYLAIIRDHPWHERLSKTTKYVRDKVRGKILL